MKILVKRQNLKRTFSFEAMLAAELVDETSSYSRIGTKIEQISVSYIVKQRNTHTQKELK